MTLLWFFFYLFFLSYFISNLKGKKGAGVVANGMISTKISIHYSFQIVEKEYVSYGLVLCENTLGVQMVLAYAASVSALNNIALWLWQM